MPQTLKFPPGIRPAEPRDVPAMLAIYAPYVEKTAISFEYEVPGEVEFAGRLTEFGRQYPFLVWEQEGQVAGYAYGSPNYTRAAYQWTAETSIYLDARFHHRGGGRALYNALLSALSAQNYCVVYALVNSDNMASMAFHDAFGFVEIGRYVQTGYKLGAWHDVSILEKRLVEPFPVPPPPVVPFSQLRKDFR